MTHLRELQEGEVKAGSARKQEPVLKCQQMLLVQRDKEMRGQGGWEASVKRPSTRRSADWGTTARETTARAASKHRHGFISVFSFQNTLAYLPGISSTETSGSILVKMKEECGEGCSWQFLCLRPPFGAPDAVWSLECSSPWGHVGCRPPEISCVIIQAGCSGGWLLLSFVFILFLRMVAFN